MLAQKLGVHKDTVNQWAVTGRVPAYAIAYLSLVMHVRRLYFSM